MAAEFQHSHDHCPYLLIMFCYRSRERENSWDSKCVAAWDDGGRATWKEERASASPAPVSLHAWWATGWSQAGDRAMPGRHTAQLLSTHSPLPLLFSLLYCVWLVPLFTLTLDPLSLPSAAASVLPPSHPPSYPEIYPNLDKKIQQ